MGRFLGLVLGGIVTSEFGWEVPFYAHASAATVWFLFYVFLVYSSPDEHPRISEVEHDELWIQFSLTFTLLSK